MKGYKIEICANSSESAIIAQRSGADRVELCAGMPEGGTTPSFGEIAAARTKLKRTKLHVIIRPRGGDFCYSPAEIRIMTNDIKMASSLNVDGFVFGCLTPDGDVDSAAMKKLMKATKGKSVTFHRAFDMCRDPFRALENIIALGCDRILTSGQQATAEKGIPLIIKLVEQAGAAEFHFSGRRVVDSPMLYRNSEVSMGGTVHIDEYARLLTDPEVVKAAIVALKSF